MRRGRSIFEFGAPGAIRTPGPKIRSLVLYPAELRAHAMTLLRHKIKGLTGQPYKPLIFMARSERFELPTYGFVVRCSIQLSYERKLYQLTGM